MSIGDTPLRPRPQYGEHGITYRQHLVAVALQGLASNPAMAGVTIVDAADFAVCVANEVVDQLDRAAAKAAESGENP